MYEGHTVAVVVPAYNEEGYVGPTIDTMPSFVDRVYVVDDASTDDTWSEIRSHAAAVNESRSPEAPGFDRVVVPLQHETNRGVGGAIKTGYQNALADGVDVAAVMGGDHQMNPAELHRYVEPIVRGEADYAKGCRFLDRADWADIPRFRLVGNVLLSYLSKAASGYWRLLDPQNGYTAISTDALARVDLDAMYEYYGYCNDLLVKLNVENIRVADVPRSSTFAFEDEWKSHIDYGEYVPRVSWMLLRNFFYRLNRKYLFRDFHPLALVYYLGLGLAGFGLARLGASALPGRGGAAEASGSGGAAWWTLLLGVVLLLHAAVLDAVDNEDLVVQIHERPEAPAEVEPTADAPTDAAESDPLAADGGAEG